MLSSNNISNATYSEIHPAPPQPQAKYMLRKITLYATSAEYVSTNKWRFTLNAPMKNVVYMDWALISNVGGSCLLAINEIPNSGISSSGQGYFCSLVGGSTQNLYNNAIKPIMFQPISFNQLTLTLYGSFTQANGWFIEFYVYSLE